MGTSQCHSAYRGPSARRVSAWRSACSVSMTWFQVGRSMYGLVAVGVDVVGGVGVEGFDFDLG